MERIGVFLCHCSLSPLKASAAENVIEAISQHQAAAYAEIYQDMCLQPELERVKRAIREKRLNGVVLTSCSPSLHQESFRNLMTSVGLASHQFEVADLRERVNGGTTAEKVIELVENLVERLVLAQLPSTIRLPVTKNALVIGGGVAGIQASLDIADAGYEVFLVERNPSIGGHMLQYSEVFPTLDCPQCIMTPKMVEVGQHPNIKLLTYSEVEQVSGQVGNFTVRVKRKASYVDWDKCTGCGECINVCPVEIYSEYERGIATQKAIYKPFGQAVPAVFTVEKKGIAPCRVACPLHVNAQGYIALISQGRFAEALSLVREKNPFPGICGRICTHPCESQCTREKVDMPLAIMDLKRFVADQEKELGADLTISPEREERVAVIGAGPAGLMAAYELRRMGYQVTIFEALPFAGGMMRVGIPEYRLPRDILEKEVSLIQKMGVEIRFDTTIGEQITLADLKKEFSAVFIAVGAHVSARLGVDGEDLAGVKHGIDFLKEVNMGGKVNVGDKVAVVGGGNAAIDAARAAHRLGAEAVFIVYRRSRAEMPASPSEVAEAEREGIKIHFLTSPGRIVGEDGRVKGMECLKMKLGSPDESGRRRPVSVEGSEFFLEADMIIPAIGQIPNVSFIDKEIGVRLKPRDLLEADDMTLQTTAEGIFAGGDAVTGPNTVIDALAAGRRAAISIDRYLREENLTVGRESVEPRISELEVDIEGITKRERVEMPVVPPAQRAGNFKEVALGLSEEEAIREAKRCLACPGCCECRACEKVCEPKVINHEMLDRYEELEVGAIVLATGFELIPKKEIAEFEPDPDILDGIQFERILCPGGSTAGVVVRPSDGKTPREVVFISCVGSRDPEHGVPYCSRVCCMYLAKMAMLYKHAVPDGQAYVFYMDIRSTGKGYEEFMQRAVEEDGVLYLRGRVSKVFRDGEKLKVWGVDTLSGKRVEISCDLVVLGMAMVPNPTGKELAQKLGMFVDEYGFISEVHPKLRPLETSVPGIYVAGTAQGPKDIPDSVSQASGAASKVLALFSSNELVLEKVAER